jgi:hypothetical protein
MDCQNTCNNTAGCNYFYTSGNKCFLGNKPQPSYAIPNYISDLNNTTKYKLYVKNKELNTKNIDNSMEKNFMKGVNPIFPKESNGILSSEINYSFIGPDVSNPNDLGPVNTPPGLALNLNSKAVNIGDGTATFNTAALNKPPSSAVSIVSDVKTYQGSSNKTNTASVSLNNDTSRAMLSSALEGFDTHGYADPTDQCGINGNPPCIPGVLYGQMNPLKKISKDYINATAKIDKNYRDLTANINTYMAKRNTLTANPKYDYNGSQPIELGDTSTLQSKMQDDAKALALQTNNMYMAGSILTTTLLISAIYLGKV